MLPLYFQDCFIIFVALTRHAVSAYTINITQEVAVHRFLFFCSTANIRFLQRLPLSFTFYPTELRTKCERPPFTVQKAVFYKLKDHVLQCKRSHIAKALIIRQLQTAWKPPCKRRRKGQRRMPQKRPDKFGHARDFHYICIIQGADAARKDGKP